MLPIVIIVLHRVYTLSSLLSFGISEEESSNMGVVRVKGPGDGAEAFLPRDATQNAVMRLYVVCLSIRLSVRPSETFRYRDHIGWNTSKIISRPNSLRSVLTMTPTWAIWCNGNTPKLGWNRGGVRSTKNVQYLRNGTR